MSKNELIIPVDGSQLGGTFNPAKTGALVLFAHGSGSSRHSPRNQFVADALHRSGIGTLLFDLMTEEEEQAEAQTRHLRFDIEFLARRLIAVTQWSISRLSKGTHCIGYFGSSTGAAAALVAAVEMGDSVMAVVSRGGRPDLAGNALERVKAPTLLIVGGNDTQVITLNQKTYDHLHCQKELKIIPGATHLFEEPGALEIVATMSSGWFANYLLPTLE